MLTISSANSITEIIDLLICCCIGIIQCCVFGKVTGCERWWRGHSSEAVKLTRFVVQDSDGLDDVDRVDETVVVDVHAEPGQVAGVAQRGKLLLADDLVSLRLDDMGVHDVAVVQGGREGVFRVAQRHLWPQTPTISNLTGQATSRRIKRAAASV